MNTYFKDVVYLWLLSFCNLFFVQVILSIASSFFCFVTKAISTENTEGSTHSITTFYKYVYKRKRKWVDLFIIKLRELEKLDSNYEHFSSKNVWRFFIDCIFTFFIRNNCVTISGGFRMVCLEKCILEILLAAINYMKGDNLSESNEWVMRRFKLVLINFWYDAVSFNSLNAKVPMI